MFHSDAFNNPIIGSLFDNLYTVSATLGIIGVTIILIVVIIQHQ